MAGKFGLFNVTKEGPGVAKNAPKKRGFVVFFEIYARKFWSLLVAGLLWLVVSLPLITRGWADAGLTYITRNYAREKHAFIKEDFFDIIKRNRKQAFICGLINLVVTGIILFNLYFYISAMYPELIYTLLSLKMPEGEVTRLDPSLMDRLSMGCAMLAYTLFTWMKYYISFLVVTFNLKTSRIYKNAFLFAVAGLKRNLLISAVLIAVYGVLIGAFLLMPYPVTLAVVAILWILLVPAFRSFLIQYNIFPEIKRLMIDPYYKDNPDADKQARLDLNLEVETTAEDTAKEEPVFTDTLPTEPAPSTIPKQYNEREMRRFTNQVQKQDEDDDTI